MARTRHQYRRLARRLCGPDGPAGAPFPSDDDILRLSLDLGDDEVHSGITHLRSLLCSFHATPYEYNGVRAPDLPAEFYGWRAVAWNFAIHFPTKALGGVLDAAERRAVEEQVNFARLTALLQPLSDRVPDFDWGAVRRWRWLGFDACDRDLREDYVRRWAMSDMVDVSMFGCDSDEDDG